jgi:uncharacterized membrane protein YfcA
MICKKHKKMKIFEIKKTLKIFIMSFLQIGLVAINTKFIQESSMLFIFTTSFLISIIWTLNVNQVVTSTWKNKIVYALGGATGSITGILIIEMLKK